MGINSGLKGLNVKFLVLTEVLMKNPILWDVTPFWLVYRYWRFDWAFCLHPQFWNV